MRGTQDPVSQEYVSSNLTPCTTLEEHLAFHLTRQEYTRDAGEPDLAYDKKQQGPQSLG